MPTRSLLNRLAVTGSALLVAGAPTSTGSTETTPTPTPTLSKKQQADQDVAHAVEEAERIVDEALMDPSEHKTYPAELKKYADPDGPYWALQAQGLKGYRKEGKRFSATTRTKQLTPAGTDNPNQVTLYRCGDFTGGKVLDKDGKTLSEGSLTESRLIVRKSKDGWRVWGYEHLDDDRRVTRTIDKCEANPK